MIFLLDLIVYLTQLPWAIVCEFVAGGNNDFNRQAKVNKVYYINAEGKPELDSCHYSLTHAKNKMRWVRMAMFLPVNNCWVITSDGGKQVV